MKVLSPAMCRPGPQIFLKPARMTRPEPRMYSSMPRISKETWCSAVCGPLARAMEWCWLLIRMKCMTSPMCGELSVSERAKPRWRSYHSRVRFRSGELRTTWESLTGMDSFSSILRCCRTCTSAETSMVRPSTSKKRKP
ncbi:hypothetical protein STENM223S_06251 [Streptomyces tendae]